MLELRILNNKMHISSEVLVVFAYCLFVVINIFNSTQIDSAAFSIIVRLISYCTLALLLFAFFSCRHDKNVLLWMVILSVVGVISAICSDELSSIILLVAFVISGSMIKSDAIFKYYIYFAMASLLIIIALYAGGFYPYKYIDYDGRFRLYLGFNYPTFLPKYFLGITMTYLVVKKNRISIVETIVIASCNFILKQLTDTRIVFYVVILLLVLCWMLRIVPWLFKTTFFKACVTVCMPLLAVSSLGLSVFYRSSNDIMFMLNKLLSGRLSLGHDAIDKFGFTLFGQKIKWATGEYGIDRFEDYFYVDSFYIKISLAFGIVVMAFLVCGFTMLARRAFKDENFMVCIVILIIAIFCLTDPEFFELKYNPFLILIGMALLEKKELPFKYKNDNNNRFLKQKNSVFER